MKNSDTRKQKEFFEKKRMQDRHNLIRPPLASPKKGNVGNMDLLTMFIVNQIALKKEHTGISKRRHLPKSKGIDKSMRWESLELPMSPCSPSCLILAESESHYSDQTLGVKKRKHSFLDEFKFKTLSPLLETNLTDNSTSVCQHRVQGSVGSFSSASPSSSEAFNIQSRPTVHISPPPPTESHCTKNAQPVGVCEYNLWTVPYQTETSQTSYADGVQFKSTFPSRESSGLSIHSIHAENPFNHLEMNDQEDKAHFFGLISGGEDISSKRTTKLHLQKETPHPPTRSPDFTESYNKDRSIDFLSQHVSRCVDCRPCRVHRIVSEHACESPVACSQGEGYVSSDDVTNSVPSLKYILSQEKGRKQDGDSYMHMCHFKDILTSHQGCCPSGMSAPTSIMSFNQKMMCNHEHRERKSNAHGISKTLRGLNQELACEEDQFVPSCLQTKTQSGIMHKKASPRTQDKVTQTAGFPSLTLQDASVQCCLLKAADRMSIFTEPTAHVHHSRRHKAPTTRRQTHHSSKNHVTSQFALSKIHELELNTCRMTSKMEPAITGHESLSRSESQACMKKHPLLHCSHTNAPELKEQASENMMLRGERCEGHEEESVNQNPTENSSCTEEHDNAFTAETGGDRVSEGKGNLKEIADILLMLKQKKKHP
ncbi:uncharacterized protein LOC128623347 [Ictalurus furcatus]|uniref:uncharacterized protein LOC128623347 n=1 Tax=Ictalurus furcatus TaxID=66913 RepID=UPI00235089B6|nr:uncharacterized protein LOC128623347 [Ictalurus furcatus]